MTPASRRPKSHAVFAFAEHAALGRRLARRLRWSFRAVQARAFPDRESLVRVRGPPYEGRALLLRSLDDPNRALVECILAAETLRERGARSVSLAAPYLGYMRQDRAFRPGEAVSQRIVGGLLGRYFDRLYTVDAHLHRTPDLAAVFPMPAVNLSAGPLIARRVRALGGPGDVVVAGPDAESEPWVRAVAREAGVPFLVGAKRRLGDRDVRLRLPTAVAVRGKTVALVDDVVSTGRTALEAARILRRRRPRALALFAVHALFAPGAQRAVRRAYASVTTTNSIPGHAGDVDLAPLLAEAVRRDEEDTR